MFLYANKLLLRFTPGVHTSFYILNKFVFHKLLLINLVRWHCCKSWHIILQFVTTYIITLCAISLLLSLHIEILFNSMHVYIVCNILCSHIGTYMYILTLLHVSEPVCTRLFNMDNSVWWKVGWA